MNVLEGKLTAKGMKIAIVVARFNEFITSKLLSGCVDCLIRHEAADEDLTEIPMAAKKLAESGKYDAVICLGAVIRGATPHFDYVCAEASKGIAQVSMQTGVPVAFGVLTTENIQQAVERAGTKAGNKGVDCAMTAMEMVNLFKNM